MSQTPGKNHLTALDILLELRSWLADNIEMQAEPAIVAHLPNGYLLTQAGDDQIYAKQLEEALLRGSTVEIHECLSYFGNYFERSRDTPPYYPHDDAVNGIDCALYVILFDAAYPDAELAPE